MIPTQSQFQQMLSGILRTVANVEGQLTEREIACLTCLASVRTASGEVLEIGTFKGRSTIVLAMASQLGPKERIVAVDPLTSPGVTDPVLKGGESSAWEPLQANLKVAQVAHLVEMHQQYSADLARTWPAGRKLRLLWIDGDHTYRGAKTDFDLFSPFLADGAIVAMHDVLHHHGGPARVFAEDMLLSSHFGAAGFSGSIGWSQYSRDPHCTAAWQMRKLDLYRRLTRVISYTAFGGEIEGTRKIGYKLARARVPHGDLRLAAWAREVRLPGARIGPAGNGP
jgi:predicted O-methyltransferase YrrM